MQRPLLLHQVVLSECSVLNAIVFMIRGCSCCAPLCVSL